MRFSSSSARKVNCLRILDEIEQVGVRAAELVFAVHAERVVPDDPTAGVEADLLAEQLQLGGILVADGQPERARRLERPMHGRNPSAATGPVTTFSRPTFIPTPRKPIELAVEIRNARHSRLLVASQLQHCRARPERAAYCIPVKQLYVGEKSRPGRMLDLGAVTRLVFALGGNPPAAGSSLITSGSARRYRAAGGPARPRGRAKPALRTNPSMRFQPRSHGRLPTLRRPSPGSRFIRGSLPHFLLTPRRPRTAAAATIRPMPDHRDRLPRPPCSGTGMPPPIPQRSAAARPGSLPSLPLRTSAFPRAR